MQIKKRSFPMYVFLNILTLGIYGFVVSMQINKEIDSICNGDGESPRYSYLGAVMFRGIAPVVGLVLGLILSLLEVDYIPSMGIPELGAAKAIVVFISMISYGVVCTVVGDIFSGLYLRYWWYKQVNRLKLNACRYGLEVHESGTETFAFRSILELFFLPITVAILVFACALPLLCVWLVTLGESVGAVTFAVILLFIFTVPLLFFSAELTFGSTISMHFLFKNLNRFADATQRVDAFDPMAYEYYPALASNYQRCVPELIKLTPAEPSPKAQGGIIGVKGSCAGYRFDINSGDEIVIGKDATVSNVVIDPSYKEVSRKHVSIIYDGIRDQYRVVDFSSNGTWANGSKLIIGQEVYLSHGSELKLANDKNIFRLV